MTKKKRRIIFAALLAAFLFSVTMVVRQQAEYRRIEADREAAARIAGLEEASPEPEPAASAVLAASREPEPPQDSARPLTPDAERLAQVDLLALREVNGDVAGWIDIPGTELSYPLMQGPDNQYYLNRNWKNQASSGGSLFLEWTNRKDLSDFHTIVYGHRMRDDSMFGTLKYYDSLDFWREHPCVYVALYGRVYRYEIFSAQQAEVRGIVYRLDLQQSGLEEEFVQYCVENSVIDTGVTPDPEGRFLTLSTCVDNGRNYAKRWVVHAVLRDVWTVE